MKKQWSNSKGGLLVVVIFMFVLGVDIGLVYLYQRHVNNFLAEQSLKDTADAAIVFFGDYTKKGKLGPDSKNRANTAFELFRQKKVKDIVCVGGYYYRQWQGKPHEMKNYLVGLGVPDRCIVYDSLSFNTITNWKEAQKIIEYKQYNKIVAISAPLHIYRISCRIDAENVFYATYTYKLDSMTDYWAYYKDVHHEWVSRFLDLTLKDRVRNRLVYIFRIVLSEIKNVI
ncbi:MAG: YdcF family protein [Bacteroidales bacterium]